MYGYSIMGQIREFVTAALVFLEHARHGDVRIETHGSKRHGSKHAVTLLKLIPPRPGGSIGNHMHCQTVSRFDVRMRRRGH